MAQNARDRLNYLWRQIILPKPLLTTPDIPDHVEGPERFDITHRTQVDFENPDEALLFKPMDQKKLDEHPVNPDEVQEDCPFPQYDPAGDVGEYTDALCTVVERWGSLGSLRPSILSELNVLDIYDTMNIRPIRYCRIMLLLCIPLHLHSQTNITLVDAVPFIWARVCMAYTHTQVLTGQLDWLWNHSQRITVNYIPTSSSQETNQSTGKKTVSSLASCPCSYLQ